MTITIGMVIFSIICGLGLTTALTLTIYSSSWIEQYEYSEIIGVDEKMDYILNEMSCQTIMLSSELQESVEPIPLTKEGMIDKVSRAETIEECWDHCQVLMPGFESEPDHYFIHVPFGDDGYMSFAGLDQLVQECKRQ